MARPQIFDPSLGQEGEYRNLTDAEIREAAGNLPSQEGDAPDPTAPVIPQGGPSPTTNPNLFNIDEEGNPVVTTDPTTGQQAFQIRGDLLGGEIVDQRLGDPSVNPNVTTQQLDTRAVALNQGFQGTPTDALTQAYIQDAAGQRGLVDPFGFKSAKGVQTDISNDPNALIPEGAILRTATIDPNAQGTLLNVNDPALTMPDVTATQTQAVATDADQVQKATAQTVATQKTFDAIKQQDMEAEQFLNDIQQVRAQSAQLEERSTVKGQLGMLMEDFAGDTIPLWASGAIAGAESILAARGITPGSSIYQGALVDAAMKAGIPIAQADAQLNARFQELNLNNRQQAEVVNANNLLNADIKELDIRQQTAVLNTNKNVQALFTDASEVNAARKFNATNIQQTDQYFANLQQAVNLNTANQRNAISQFNAGQGNAISQFNVSAERAADEFYSRNQLVINQANAQWRRSVNTANTAAINATNQFNAANVLNKSNTAHNNLLQLARDNADYVYNSAQNDASRANNLAIATIQADAQARAAAAKNGGGGSFLGAAGGILGTIAASFAGTESGGKIIGEKLFDFKF